MILNEKEAVLRWCPFSRVSVRYQDRFSAVNRVKGEDSTEISEGATRCIGSRCMAWRWHNKSILAGFCGLAGQPIDGV